MKKKYLLALSAGHAFTDMNQGALPAIIPYLIAAGGLKYAQVAGFTFAISITSSIMQPVFGIMADRLSKAWLLPIGVLLGGLGLSLIGFFPNHYWLMFTVAIVSGIGIAAYHPDAARMANKVAGKKKAGGMSIFTVGGNVGVACGPLLITPALLYIGLRGSIVMVIPSLVMFFVFLRIIPMMRNADVPEGMEKHAQAPVNNDWGKFLLLGITIVCRSVVLQSTNTFLPLFWINVLQQSKAESGMTLSFMLFWGATATLTGGFLADRIGVVNVIRIGWVILIPSLGFLTMVTNPFAARLILIPFAFGLNLFNTPTVLLGQKYLPKNIGFASGITMGLGNSLGGIAAPFIGMYADLHGLTSTLRLLWVLPIIGTLVALTLKQPRSDPK